MKTYFTKTDALEKPPFKDREFYKTYFASFVKISFSVLGDTMAVWGSFLILNFFFTGIWPNVHWFGIDYFINDGKIILISFSFLSGALYYSTRKPRNGWLLVIVSASMVFSAGIYTRAIVLSSLAKSKHQEVTSDSIVYGLSIFIFFFSIILYYISVLREKKIENREGVEIERQKQQNKLERAYRKKAQNNG